MKITRKKQKILAVILSVLMLLSSSHIFESYATPVSNPIDSLIDNPIYRPIDNLISQPIQLDERDRPEAVSLEQVKSVGHIKRLYEEEFDLNTILFENNDLTRTMYYYTDPVKFTDDAGNIKDKSNKLYLIDNKATKDNKYAYVNRDNDINTYFPEVIGNGLGILLTYEDIKIELTPISKYVNQKSVIKVKRLADNLVYYSDVFGKNTGIQYTPIFNGFKEEIVLYKNTGNIYSFILKTGNLTPVLDNNHIYLLDGTKEIVGTVEDIVVYDSAKDRNSSYGGTYMIEETKVLGEYIINVIVDEQFLMDPTTIYPVFIDPTITVNVSNSGTAKTIQDVPIYNSTKAASLASGSNAYNLVGYVGTSGGVNYGVGRTLIRLPGIYTGVFTSLALSQITNFTLSMYESSGQSTSSTVYCNYYTGASSWVETTANYNNTSWSAYGSIIDSQTFGSSSGRWVNFNLKNAVSTWQSSYDTFYKGIMIRNSNETTSANRKDFSSTESSNKPYITLTWNPINASGIVSGNLYRIKNVNGKYLRATADNSFSQVTSVSSTNGCELWRITSTGSTGIYRIESLGVRTARPSTTTFSTQPNMLTGTRSSTNQEIGSLSLSTYSATSTAQQWYINYRNNNYYLLNVAYPNLVINVSNNTATPRLSTEYTGTAWTLENVIRTDYWSNRYSGAPTSVVVNVIIEPTAVTGLLTESVYNVATVWNGIDSNMTIRYYPSTFTGTPAAANFTIRVRGVDSSGARYGRIVPTPDDINSTWTSAVLEISTESSGTNQSKYRLEDRQMNFLHELGHGLKLAHPHQATSNYRPVSIMNQGLPSDNYDVPSRPSGHDQYNLSRKW